MGSLASQYVEQLIQHEDYQNDELWEEIRGIAQSFVNDNQYEISGHRFDDDSVLITLLSVDVNHKPHVLYIHGDNGGWRMRLEPS